jgi:hypothetical protein
MGVGQRWKGRSLHRSRQTSRASPFAAPSPEEAAVCAFATFVRDVSNRRRLCENSAEFSHAGGLGLFSRSKVDQKWKNPESFSLARSFAFFPRLFTQPRREADIADCAGERRGYRVRKRARSTCPAGGWSGTYVPTLSGERLCWQLCQEAGWRAVSLSSRRVAALARRRGL